MGHSNPSVNQSNKLGIATKYKGITFRSRLEARWAAFFDAYGWQWEYEPFDGNGYIPDFVLLGAAPVAVEVKPAANASEMLQYVDKVDNGLPLSLWPHDAIIVGLSPIIRPIDSFAMDWYPTFGLLGEAAPHDDARRWGDGCHHMCGFCHSASFHHYTHAYRSRLCGHYDGDHFLDDANASAIKGAWLTAVESARWAGR